MKFPVLLSAFLIFLNGCTVLHIIDVAHSSALVIDSLMKEKSKNIEYLKVEKSKKEKPDQIGDTPIDE